MLLEEVGGVGWFNRELVMKVDNGMGTLFWKDSWATTLSLMKIFPRLFSISSCQDAKVGDMWRTNLEEERRRFIWRRELFVWERDLLNTLVAQLEGVVVGEGVDCWSWKQEKEGGFTVKSACYTILQSLLFVDEVLQEKKK